MPSEEIKIKYYGLNLTKRDFIIMYSLVIVFCLIPAIYFFYNPIHPKFFNYIPDSFHWMFKNIPLYSGIWALITIIEAQFIWNRFAKKQLRIIEDLKSTLEVKNNEILGSIEYALRIQTAILPPQKIVQKYLENSFILYKPKDIVAGDFYWMENIGDLVLFAACDCTGHGVPGAMVSVVCHNALNRAVREFGLRQPAAILDKATEIVVENFSKSEEEIQDGMDISICALNLKSKTLEWAGANNPLWLIINDELIETKADKQCIGYNSDLKPFTNHQFTLESNTNIYLFSDGFSDQFGGNPEKKLSKNRFKELLLSVQHLPLQQQAIELDKFISNHQNGTEQTDDILVIGIRV
jgi:serine phosphatase RsbU (regulator of sigma subunit)